MMTAVVQKAHIQAPKKPGKRAIPDKHALPPDNPNISPAEKHFHEEEPTQKIRTSPKVFIVRELGGKKREPPKEKEKRKEQEKQEENDRYIAQLKTRIEAAEARGEL